MRRAILSLVSVAAFAASVGTASACTSGIIRSYFSYERPTITGYSVRLLVGVPSGYVSGVGPIRARLLSGAPGPSDDGFVRIQFPEAAARTNCVNLGPTDGPVYVVGALQRSTRGELILIAEARPPTRSPSVLPRARLRASDYDRYIIDPAYLTPEGRRRREERRK